MKKGFGRQLINAGETIGAAAHSASYGYDCIGQLGHWQIGFVHQQSYTYDKAGNVQERKLN
jgi:hypothetical protein